MKKKIIIVLLVLFILCLIGVFIFLYIKNEEKKELAALKAKEEKEYVESIKKNYSPFVITLKETDLYNENGEKIGKINKNVKLELNEKEIDSIDDDYFELTLFENHYVFFKDVIPVDSMDEKSKYYKNYVVFNENCVTNDKTKFYDENFNYLYEVNYSIDAPIYIKENEYYGVEFKDSLVYLKKDEVSVEKKDNTKEKNATSIPILLYHFFHEHSNYENMTTVISMRTDKFENQLKYLSDNNFMTLKLKDLELYIDGKIQIKENSVVLTIDDGDPSIYTLAYPIIEKYKTNVTVFNITAWRPNAYNKRTEYVEIHSHTHDMHQTGKCKGGQGGWFKCISHNAGVEDLKKSSELCGGTTYLAYPFGEYTDSSIQILKDAGYTMALTTNYGNAKVGQNKYLLPRIYMYNEYTLEKFKRLVN